MTALAGARLICLFPVGAGSCCTRVKLGLALIFTLMWFKKKKFGPPQGKVSRCGDILSSSGVLRADEMTLISELNLHFRVGCFRGPWLPRRTFAARGN